MQSLELNLGREQKVLANFSSYGEADGAADEVEVHEGYAERLLKTRPCKKSPKNTKNTSPHADKERPDQTLHNGEQRGRKHCRKFRERLRNKGRDMARDMKLDMASVVEGTLLDDDWCFDYRRQNHYREYDNDYDHYEYYYYYYDYYDDDHFPIDQGGYYFEQGARLFADYCDNYSDDYYHFDCDLYDASVSQRCPWPKRWFYVSSYSSMFEQDDLVERAAPAWVTPCLTTRRSRSSHETPSLHARQPATAIATRLDLLLVSGKKVLGDFLTCKWACEARLKAAFILDVPSTCVRLVSASATLLEDTDLFVSFDETEVTVVILPTTGGPVRPLYQSGDLVSALRNAKAFWCPAEIIEIRNDIYKIVWGDGADDRDVFKVARDLHRAG